MNQQDKTEISNNFYRASAADFMKIPGSPVAYWVSNRFFEIFSESKPLSDFANIGKGLDTGDNNRFLRYWQEVNIQNNKWVPCQKGGPYRKWYGNNDYFINWENNGKDLKDFSGSNLRNSHNYFNSGLTWTRVSSSSTAFRYFPTGHIFESTGPCLFVKNINQFLAAGFLNSTLSETLLKFIAPTLDFQSGHISKLPIIQIKNNTNIVEINSSACIDHTKNDWDSYEASWDFTLLPLLAHNIKQATISHNYTKLREQWLADTQEMQRLEEENNRIFIDAYGLQDELTPEVPLKEITLTCNPHYRYGGDLTKQEREDRLQSDTIAELISYVIGCMMGRYSLDREGLVYAHAGNEGFADLVAEGAYKTFAADDDGILPLTEQEWFSDDVTNRISEFVRTVWGEQHLEENLQFIADSLCLYVLKAKKGERALDTIRRYLSNQFYKDHLKTYKRRPIYWLFSSGKHKAFECLVYLHRYHEGTLARMRAEYVIPLSSRINARINRLSEEADAAESTAERNQINRELKTLHNQQAELATFDEQLRHHADQRISLELDDGVKKNYGKFGDLLAAVNVITGKV